MIKKVIKSLKEIKMDVSKRHSLNKFPSNIELLNYYSVKPKEIITKPGRTISGVAPIAVMTKPFRCPHVKLKIGPCSYCPGGPKSYFGDMPQSYTGKEPAVRRAVRNNFDSYLQVFNRLEQYVLLNQNFEKVEIIIMGGTFPAINKKYQETFVMYIFKALNDFSKLFFKGGQLDFIKFKRFFELPKNISDEDRINKIQKKILKLKKNSDLQKEQLINEGAKIKCVALCIETRPDYCKENHIKQMLKLGCTRVELGVQSLDDNILKFIRRGHSVRDSINSTRLLKDAFFKVGYHMMLFGNDNFKGLWKEDFRPDALKIYPCMVFRGTKLYELWKQGKYKPITTNEATEIISKIKQDVPEYCRILRIQRDIPSNLVIAGVDRTNLRQYVFELMKKKGIKCRCIRCREPRGKKLNLKDLKIKILKYKASDGMEYFISGESNDMLYGFCRLRISKKAGIRELHVYGEATSLGKRGNVQHKGLGKRLMFEAERIARRYKIKKLYVISGIGVKKYYFKLGFKKDGYYMSKELK